MSVRRECCNYCMWLGPVNKDNTMRKHRPAREGTVSGERKVQDFTKPHCPGSNKPYARFGCETENTTEQETSTVTETTPRYIVNQLGNGSFAVRDTVTDLNVAATGSRYAAQDKADRLGKEAAPASEICSCPRGESNVYRAHHRTVCASGQQQADATAERPKCGHGIKDKCGGRATELGTIPTCEPGITYGVWSEGAGGFVFSGVDCAAEAANWAADELRQLAKDDDTDKFEVLAICREHGDQPANGCEDCNTEDE